jgi:hypothetical protein
MTTPKPASTASSVQASKPLRLSWVHPFGNPRPSRGNYLSGEQVIERSYCVGRSVTKGIGIGTVANHDLNSDNPNSDTPRRGYLPGSYSCAPETECSLVPEMAEGFVQARHRHPWRHSTPCGLLAQIFH